MYPTKRKSISIISLLVALLMCFLSVVVVNADVTSYNAVFQLSNQIDKPVCFLNENFTVDYKVTPDPIPVASVQAKEKEIYLVIDTSGSMDWDINGNSARYYSNKRLSIAKAAANKFIDTLAGKTGVKVGLISYSNTAVIKQALTSDFSSLKNKISYLSATGGTNMGDGLRRAYYELGKGSANAEKYIIFLTDGQPTYHSINYNQSFYMGGDTAPSFQGGGDHATAEDIEYCNRVISDLINTSTIKSYMIAFTSGSNSNVMENLATRANGVYKQALNSDALNDIYIDTAAIVAADMKVDVAFEEVFPSGISIVTAPGLTITGNIVSGNAGSILYNLNTEKTYYVASPVNFYVTLKGTALGQYSLGAGNTSKLVYTDIDGSKVISYFDTNTVKILEYGALYPMQIKSKTRSGEEVKVDVSYTIPAGTKDYSFTLKDNNGTETIYGPYSDSIQLRTFTLPSIYKSYSLELTVTSAGDETKSTELVLHDAADIN